MKFFIEFVSCCGSCSRAAGGEETRSLVPIAAGQRVRKRVRRVAAVRVGGGHAAEWKPTLSSICEDNVLPQREREQAVNGSERTKRKKESTQKALGNQHREDARRVSLPVVMPVFSPTPFMF